MDPIKMEGFQYPMSRPRPDFRRPFSDGSMAIPTSELAASLPNNTTQFIPPFSYNQPFFQAYSYGAETMPPPPVFDERARSLSRGSIGKAPRSRSGRKGSMTDVKPAMPRARTASNRALSYSHPDGRPSLGLDTHLEHQRTNSISPPDYTYGMIPQTWNGSGSMQSMQSFGTSFGTTIDEAILDSPISPSHPLPPLPQDANEETKKQRRRECHNQVEKRRREHINQKIEELSHMLPPQYVQTEEIEEEEEEELDSPKKKKNRRNSVAKQKDLAPCKGRILTHSVQYIHDLRHVNDLQATRIQQLESLLASTSFVPAPNLPLPTSMFYEQHGLQALRPSPEPETYNQNWNPFNPVFETSPDGHTNSSGSDSLIERPLDGRHDMQMDLQMSMTGMDLENVFTTRREDESGMRW